MVIASAKSQNYPASVASSPRSAMAAHLSALDSSMLEPIALRQESSAGSAADDLRAPVTKLSDWSRVMAHDTTALKYQGYLTLPPLTPGRLGDGLYDDFIRNMLTIKKAYAIANVAAGKLEPQYGQAIASACHEISENLSTHRAYFWSPIYMGGCRTPFNMNVNGVVAARANEYLSQAQQGNQLSSKGDACSALCAPLTVISANDHVNKGQSTNDVIPAAFILSMVERLGLLHHKLESLSGCLADASPRARDINALLCERIVDLQTQGMQHFPLLATATGTGATAEGLEPYLYPALNDELRVQGASGARPHPSLINATVDTSWYVEVENTLGDVARALKPFAVAHPDMQLLLDTVSDVGTRVVKMAHEKGGAFNLNSMDPQFDWTIMSDMQRLAQVMDALHYQLTHAKAPKDPLVGSLVRAKPEGLVDHFRQVQEAVHSAAQQTRAFAQSRAVLGQNWLLFTEHQPAVAGRISDTLTAYADDLDRQFSGVMQQWDVTARALAKVEKMVGDTMTPQEQMHLKTALEKLSLCLAVFERIAKDFTQRNKERDITLETIAPGSSIMPGKINPPVCEAIQMLVNQADAHAEFLIQHLTNLQQPPTAMDCHHASYHFDSCAKSFATAARYVERLMKHTEVNAAMCDYHLLSSGALMTLFRDKVTRSGGVVDYVVAGALGKTLKAVQTQNPAAGLKEALSVTNGAFKDAMGNAVFITLADIEDWLQGDWVQGVHAERIVV